MSIRTRNKISLAFSAATMSDLVFLLLIFFMITSTLISPNALKLLLPKSDNQVQANKPVTTVSITPDLQFYVETQNIGIDNLEQFLQQKIGTVTNPDDAPTISLHADKSVPIEEVVKVMNIAKDNKYKLILATTAQ
ncbi:MAG: biopolymer transporter ExbD [Bacteroidetes bacterium CG02_land_8_20_14_3_00_31_25]|nr:biopolymer transporter ExbD [Bacteroidota bacterium]PIV58251.1 MAG: biopolymer transporter ExbD [Bacteroidetes bacterium CG02_land_8_20_14_3_00_31_25]PIX35686.1 MAG: biopolymer transporter ExbD [Bacteroidetes bacterium CG_4_8_14_3_um_filter_31_14]PIY02623.1 MAG: biopolymer transporter ExbD [Bacteroidetes bacterium CG_4_10_14_3_um_filter_31_20]